MKTKLVASTVGAIFLTGSTLALAHDWNTGHTTSSSNYQHHHHHGHHHQKLHWHHQHHYHHHRHHHGHWSPYRHDGVTIIYRGSFH